MWKSLKRLIWIALLILLGVQLGIHQAGKSQAATQAQAGQQSLPGIGSGVTPSEGEGWGQGLVRQVKGLAHIRLPEDGSAATPQESGPGINGNGYVDDTQTRPESFLNRLGNKLGEALRMLVSTVIGWVAGFFSSLLN